MRILLAIALAALATTPARSQVFADFETRQGRVPFGNFTVQLDHDFSPFTAANFIRLAEGLIPWLDPANGVLRTGPYYDGLEFYSLTSGFEIVTGSPSNDDTGGPGYHFRDDPRALYRDGNAAQPSAQFGLFMDNDGPNTNGSRFFINLTTTIISAVRTGQFTRFGTVLQATNPPGGNGRATVTAISQSAPGFITIDKVTMRYVGAAAQNFRFSVGDSSHPYLASLPFPREAFFSFRRTPATFFLDWDNVPGSVAQLWSSADLLSWIGPFPVANVPGDPNFGLDLAPTQAFAPTAFFRGGVIRYPDWPSTERPLANNFIRTNFFDPAVGNVIYTYAFDSSGIAGVYDGPFGAGTFAVTQQNVLGPFSTRLVLTPTTGSQPTYRFTLHYDLAWSSTVPSIALPLTANPCRLKGENLANPGAALQGGQWTYIAP